MRAEDVAQVSLIEQVTFPDPWPAHYFRQLLREADCWVVEKEGRIEAYGILTLESAGAHLLNLCVRPESRRTGLGRSMLDQLKARAVHGGAAYLYLEVRPTNTAAIRLYTGEGFFEVGRRKGYYRTEDRDEDALVLACLLIEGRSEPSEHREQ